MPIAQRENMEETIHKNSLRENLKTYDTNGYTPFHSKEFADIINYICEGFNNRRNEMRRRREKQVFSGLNSKWITKLSGTLRQIGTPSATNPRSVKPPKTRSCR